MGRWGVGKGLALLNLISTAPWAHPQVLAWDAGLATPTQLTAAESHAGCSAPVGARSSGGAGGEGSDCRDNLCLGAGGWGGFQGGGTGLEGWHRARPGLRVMVQGRPAHRAASLGCTLPALRGPPSPLPPSLFPRVGRGGDWAGLQKMARIEVPPSPSGSLCHKPRASHGLEELASVCRAGSGTPQGNAPWAEPSLRKTGVWGGAGGAPGVLGYPPCTPGPSTRHLLGSNCV